MFYSEQLYRYHPEHGSFLASSTYKLAFWDTADSHWQHTSYVSVLVLPKFLFYQITMTSVKHVATEARQGAWHDSCGLVGELISSGLMVANPTVHVDKMLQLVTPKFWVQT